MQGQRIPIEAPDAVAVPPVTILRGRQLRLARTGWLVVALPIKALTLRRT